LAAKPLTVDSHGNLTSSLRLMDAQDDILDQNIRKSYDELKKEFDNKKISE
jgi:hypothetical protein